MKYRLHLRVRAGGGYKLPSAGKKHPPGETVKAVLSREQDNLLAEIDRVLARKAPGSLKSEFLRGL